MIEAAWAMSLQRSPAPDSQLPGHPDFSSPGDDTAVTREGHLCLLSLLHGHLTLETVNFPAQSLCEHSTPVFLFLGGSLFQRAEQAVGGYCVSITPTSPPRRGRRGFAALMVRMLL